MARALLLDLDGTIIDSDPIHVAVFVDLMAEFGQRMDPALYFSRIHGRQNVDIFAEFLPHENPQAMSERKESMYRERLARPGAVAPIAGLAALLDLAGQRGLAVGLVTNAPRANADAVLAAIGIAERFDVVVIGDECARGKPDPLPYLTALADLGVAARDAFAIEDSPSGIRSARAAGLYTLGMTSSLDAGALRAAGADDTIADFNDIAVRRQLDRLTGAAA